MNVETKQAAVNPIPDVSSLLPSDLPAHLAFRQIIIHEFTEDNEPQPLRLHFHFREHSKHLSRRGM